MPSHPSFPPAPVKSPASLPRRRGAPLGNSNAFKHGFYTRRLRKRDLSGVESIHDNGLQEEIALIRVFTRRLVEACDPANDDPYFLADTLRTLCLASSTITRVIKTQHLISPASDNYDPIREALRQVNLELRHQSPPIDASPPPPAPACSLPSFNPSLLSPDPDEPCPHSYPNSAGHSE